jgi:uncharacterized protein
MIDAPAAFPDTPAPYPIREFILKIFSRCNLACDYCYIYSAPDGAWRRQPRAMSRKIVDAVGVRIAEHAATHRVPAIEVVLHGGEPLLAGPELVEYCVRRIRATLAGAAPDADVVFTVQTNGIRLRPFLPLLTELGVRVGVSLDGDQAGHDRHRRSGNGAGSHAAVRAALAELGRAEHRAVFAGLLCTVDLRNDPVDTYEALLEFAPPAIDFLLPQADWSAPPVGRAPGSPGTPYGDWLIAVFERWYAAPRQETRVRLLGEIINVLLGGRSAVESIGLSPAAMVVVDTDGSVLPAVRPAVSRGGSGPRLSVANDPFDAALRLPEVRVRQLGAAALGATCRACGIHQICGGGRYEHRYRAGAGFGNPSVYCADLYALITHVSRRLVADTVGLYDRSARCG